MFVRFRQTDRSLQVTLSATRRDAGRVRHEHIASFGSVPLSPQEPLAPADRITFWTKLHQRFDALSNQVDAAQHGAILTAIYAPIPMPTMDDHQAVQLDHARADARFWETLADGYAEQIEGNKKVLGAAQKAITEREPLAADTAAKGTGGKRSAGKGREGRDRCWHRATTDPEGHAQDQRHDRGRGAALRTHGRHLRGRWDVQVRGR
jgi:hypothetical protein